VTTGDSPIVEYNTLEWLQKKKRDPLGREAKFRNWAHVEKKKDTYLKDIKCTGSHAMLMLT